MSIINLMMTPDFNLVQGKQWRYQFNKGNSQGEKGKGEKTNGETYYYRNIIAVLR